LNDGDKKIRDGQPLSILGVQKRTADGTKLEKVRLHFRDYSLERSGDRYNLALYADNNGKCFGCHPNGVRQLIMRRTPVLNAKPVRGEKGFTEQGDEPPASFSYNRLAEFNRRLRSLRTPRLEGKISPEVFGPMVGKEERCTDCHDGKIRSF